MIEDDRDRLVAYCFRCKAKKQIKDPTETRMKNGKMAVTGTCVTCGTKMFKILPTPEERRNGSPG